MTNLIFKQAEPGTFSTSGEHSNHSAMWDDEELVIVTFSVLQQSYPHVFLL